MYPRIFQKVFHEPALITASAHQAIQSTLISALENPMGFDSRLNGDRTSKVKDTKYQLIDGHIGLLKISGVISKRLSQLEDSCGVYDQVNIAMEAKAAIEDPRVEYLIIDFDTPGGSVTGTFETGRMLRELATQKPIHAYTETQCCSCGYWLAAQCTSITMAPTAHIGCVGVYIAWAKDNEEYELVKAGKYKAMGINEISEEERAILQSIVDRTHATFKEEIRFNRPQLLDDVLEGLSYDGEDAIEFGFADALALNFDEFLQMLEG